jgi:ferritin
MSPCHRRNSWSPTPYVDCGGGSLTAQPSIGAFLNPSAPRVVTDFQYELSLRSQQGFGDISCISTAFKIKTMGRFSFTSHPWFLWPDRLQQAVSSRSDSRDVRETKAEMRPCQFRYPDPKFPQSPFRQGPIMLSQIMQDAINAQINHELFSSYSYLSMSAWCEYQQFVGCARWMRLQSQEETEHALRLQDFLLARNCRVMLKTIEQPEVDFESVLQIFEKALAQEQLVTSQIDALYELAFKEKAFAALVELEWFITEQVEEEKTAREIVHKLGMVKDDPASLLEIDRELGSRQGATDEV